MSRTREIAKFACGAEAFHALAHAALGLPGTTLTAFGVTVIPTWHIAGVAVNAVVSLLLGVYAWGPCGRRSAPGSGVTPGH